MRKVGSRNTGPEIAIRQFLFARGLRYRVQYRPGDVDIGRATIDIAFPGKRVAVFIDGCFWHGCPVHGTVPKANADWWRAKLEGNRVRDIRVRGILRDGSWDVLAFWEHESAEGVVRAIVARIRGGTERG
ncbi:MAG: very short patch repair endonuclease [Magnetococcales bacterium]|nr:very short patch repair endonuclease [Magnetococcales bacterium]